MHLCLQSVYCLPVFQKPIPNQKAMPKCCMAVCRDLSWSGEAFFFCQDEAKVKRQEGKSLIWVSFISGVLWQSAELLFYAVRLCRPCQDSLQTTHFLFRKCVFNGFSVWSFFRIKLVVCLLWFHFIWKLAEELWMKTFLIYVLFSAHRRDRTWINYDSMWNQYLGDRNLDVP